MKNLREHPEEIDPFSQKGDLQDDIPWPPSKIVTAALKPELF
jgi:hypothetical protein